MQAGAPPPNKLLITFWAKSPRKSSDSWQPHPLLCHMIDVACVAQVMWDEVLSLWARRRIAAHLGLSAQEEAAGGWIAFWAGLHDLGKTSPAFQLCDERIAKSLRKNLEQAGLPCTNPKETPHGHITAYALRLILGNDPFDLPRDVAATVAAIAGGHHGVFPSSKVINELKDDPRTRGGGSWDNARLELARQLAMALGVPIAAQPTRLPPAIAMALAGLISVADWIASDEHHFPCAPDMTLDNLPIYVAQATWQARQALRDLAWTGCAPWGRPVPFSDLFPFKPNPLQQATVDLATQLDEPGLVLIEAPMGIGKTEAAFYLARHWEERLGLRGSYFALPTQATSNQMFTRTREFLEKTYLSQVNLQLLHGHATLSRELQLLQQGPQAPANPKLQWRQP
jgi:CRISPR-associated endonuclease/helicase Cas3